MSTVPQAEHFTPLCTKLDVEGLYYICSSFILASTLGGTEDCFIYYFLIDTYFLSVDTNLFGEGTYAGTSYFLTITTGAPGFYFLTSDSSEPNLAANTFS
jgi:hypothetical protein